MIGPSRADDMESLAYTVTDILRGSLPWEEESRIGVFHAKQLWSGHDLGFGYPRIFGDFVDYTRGLKFESEPDYDRWMKAFRSLITSSDSDVEVGKSLRDKPGTSLGEIPELPESKSPWFTPYDLDYVPIHTMPSARVPTTRDLIGDEKATVRRNLAVIEQLPEMDPLCCGAPEVMLIWEQEDREEEEFGRESLNEIDKFWLQ